ncbi:multidrug resistance-associated protein 5-like isoform X2 [Cimex lectularius]|uniref:ABC Transporter n=1 Tax=Cimex lectularius TaxID=79782 RepID=A0A8I6TM22_CIMLE|nr:multidrug resistance-associated protein 5-like isoform X2 [Cimex lectularius]
MSENNDKPRESSQEPSESSDQTTPLWEDIYLEDDGEEFFDAPDDYPKERKKGDPGLSGPWDTPKQYIPSTGFSRYRPSLKNLIPVRRKSTKEQNILELDNAGLWSFLTIKWLTKYFKLAFHKGLLKVEDVPNPSPFDTCEYNVQRLETIWNEEVTKKGTQSASLVYAIWRFIRTRIIISALLFTLYVTLNFISVAFFMRYLLEFTETSDASYWEGLQWTVLLGITEITRVIIYSVAWIMNYRTSMRLRSAVLAMLYRKILRVYCMENKTVGEIVNMFANDGQRIFDLLLFAPMIVSSPVSLLFGIGYVFFMLGPWPVFGLLVMFLFYPIQYGLARLASHYKALSLKVTDIRISTITNMLSQMKFVKIYAWNDVFKDNVDEIRKKELNFVKKRTYCESFAVSVSATAPILSAILTFIIHIMVSGHLAASQAFTVISLCVGLLKKNLQFTKEGFKSLLEFNLAIRRFESVLLLSETTTYLSRPLDKSQAVCIANGYFACYLNNQITTLKKNKKIKNGTSIKDEESSDAENTATLLKQLTAPRYQVILFDINFYAPKGSLIGICGPVGSGKTSLISGILGQIRMTEGKLCRNGTCAYVSQQAWLMNATLKENILFGEKFNAKRYFAVLHCCALDKDIDLLPGADETEIGEKGVNLSGGQKQRVALARALYSNRDIYLLDDPLSAVDTQVAMHIFEKCILNALAKKTVIFVSHKIQFLSRCDEIVFMKEGRILERGSHNDLMSKSTEYKILVETYTNDKGIKKNVETAKQKEAKDKIKRNTIKRSTRDKTKDANIGKLTTVEKIEQGSIQCGTFYTYVRAVGGVLVSFLVILAVGLSVGSSAFSSWWLAQWIKAGSGVVHNFENVTAERLSDTTMPTDWNSTTENDITENYTTDITTTEDISTLNSTESDFFPTVDISSTISSMVFDQDDYDLSKNSDFEYYQIIYCLCIVAIFLTTIIRGFVVAKTCLNASRKLHRQLLDKVLKAKMIFFESVSIGRYQNLFAKDVDEVETSLPITIESLLQCLWQTTFALLFICMAYPLFVFPLILLTTIYYFVNKLFRIGARELKRLDNVTRSPIFSNITCTITGLDTIHAFSKEKAFLQKFVKSFDINATCMFMNSVANRWLAVRIDAIAVLVTLITSILVIIMHGKVPPAMAGLAISYASTLSGLFQFTVRLMNQTEIKFLSVERIDACIKGLEQEGGHGPKGIPPDLWPDMGAISFRNVKLRYRPGLPFALNDISFYVRPCEKIGIVGRTGAGKTSLISAIFRLVEICEGSIIIDNLDISTLDLITLRKRISLIPQDPVLFPGTVRSNLDPTGIYSDKEIWDALQKVNLKDRISASESKLDTKVIFGGDNLSSGEVQQLCLARVVLKKTKVMIFDEATSSLDLSTESVVQQTIFQGLSDCTVLIIAHRLETVKSCSRILVIDNGKVAEFDEPAVLLQNHNSLFCKMTNVKINQN